MYAPMSKLEYFTKHNIIGSLCLSFILRLSGPSLNTYSNWYFVLKAFLLWPTLTCELHRLSALGFLISFLSRISWLAPLPPVNSRILVVGSDSHKYLGCSSIRLCLCSYEEKEGYSTFLFGGSRLFLQSHTHTHIHTKSTLSTLLQRTNYVCSTCSENVLKQNTHIT